MSLEDIQTEWDNIKAAVNRCYGYQEKMSNLPQKQIMFWITIQTKYETLMRHISNEYKECNRCRKLTLRPEECKCGK